MTQLSLVIVLFAALLIPLIMAKLKISALPTAVIEIITGIILGQSGLHLVTATTSLNFLSDIGVIVLLFLSGMEIDFSLFQRRPIPRTHFEKEAALAAPKIKSPVRIATEAYLTIMILSILLAFFFKITGLFTDVWLAAILFSTISLGVVIATLKERELLSKTYGQTLLLIAVLGEVVPMMALTVYASVFGNSQHSLWLLSLIFFAAVILFRRFRSFFSFFERINKSTTQLDIRLAFFLVVTSYHCRIGRGRKYFRGLYCRHRPETIATARGYPRQVRLIWLWAAYSRFLYHERGYTKHPQTNF